LEWMKTKMGEWFDIKVRGMLGPDRGDLKEITILGRIVKWRDWGISYEADPKHRKILMERFQLEEGSKGLAKNGDIVLGHL